jgi:serine/threonine protein phosphatase 1
MTPRQTPPKTPPSTRIYAIGDIHGRLDLLKQLHEQILIDLVGCRAKRKLIIYMGDYVDRGMQSSEVLEYLSHHKIAKCQNVFLRGNHEFAMLSFMRNPKQAADWLNWGGDATLFSYKINLFDGNKKRKSLPQLAEEMRESIPQKHIEFLDGLQNYHIEGDYLFVHAGVRPGLSLEQQTLKDMLMIRDDFIQGGSLDAIGRTVVFGHTIFNQPFEGPQRIGIDTGAYYSGKLTALVLEGSKRSYLSTVGN